MYAHEGGGENRTGYKSPRQVQGAIPGLGFFPSMACHTMAEPIKAGCVFSPYKRKAGLFLPPFISR